MDIRNGNSRSPVTNRLASVRAVLADLPSLRITGQVSGLSHGAARVTGLAHHARIGDLVRLGGGAAMGEIAAIHDGVAAVLSFDPLHRLGVGDEAVLATQGGMLAVSDAWLGRVIDPLGRPLDGKGLLPQGSHPRPMRAPPPPAVCRARLGERFDLGVSVLDLFTPCRQGQRLGLFAGSGIGKSTLLATLARFSQCDVVVLALVGERGREVREFLEDDLGPDGLRRACVVVATSDAPPLLRRQAGYAALTVAEHFRAQGKSVLLLLDSVTRFCQALRDIALAAGEPPATRGYPASVFAELPRLLERAGPGEASANGPAGQMTAFFTVLVEGDDHNEPVADAVRGILDGHVVLDRRIAQGGRFPPVNVLASLSRTAPDCLDPADAALARAARALLSRHHDMADLARLGGYRPGTDAELDRALRLAPRIEALLAQEKGRFLRARDSFAALARLLEEEA